MWQLGPTVFGLILTYPLGVALYHLYFHPLAHFPGPRLWVAFRFCYARALWRGSHVSDVFHMHQKYGDVVRVAPDELSIAREDGLHDIYCRRYGHQPFPKDPVWWGELPGRTESLVSTPSEMAHTRMRRLMSYCLTPRAVHSQESTMEYYVDLLISRLQEECLRNVGTSRAVVNIIDWIMYTVLDIIGDLSFGESFHCLERGSFHPWLAEIFSYFKVGTLVVTLRYYTALYRLFMWSIPKGTLEAAKTNFEWGVQKLHCRLGLETERTDFMQTITARNKNEKSMSIPELESTMNVMIIAGSETCGTVLSGTINYLVKTPFALKRLTEEIRNTYETTENISFASLKDLPYLNAVVAEGLRMCPPNPGGLHHVVPPGGGFACGQWLPENTSISVHQYTLTRSPANFYLPDSFCPERWLSSSISDPTSPFYSDNRPLSQAFSVGMWSCIGKYLAYMELRFILAKLVWHFDITTAKGGRDVDWVQQKCFALVKKEPFDVSITDVRTRCSGRE